MADFILTNEDNAPSRQDEDKRSQPKLRTAIVTGGADSLKQVQAYLPWSFEATEVFAPVPLEDGVEKVIVIVGYDQQGWTLDGYVIPRLASGLIFATEVK